MIQCESSQVDLILVSFIISIFGVNSIKINILCENVSAFFYMYQAKKFLNLQVEIILGIISIIILSSLIVLNRSIIIFSESSTHQISLACCFPKVDSVITFDFFFNIIWFILISFRHQTLQKAVFDITVSNSCSKEFDGNFV